MAITLDPFKVNVAYFETPPVETKEESALRLLAANSSFISSDSPFKDGGKEDIIVQALQDILIDMVDQFPDLPRHAIFGFSSAYCMDLMSIVRYSHAPGSRFSQESVEELKEQARKNAAFRAQDLLASQKGDLDTDLELVTSSDIFFKMDGELVRDPIGLEGEELEFYWFGSFVEAPHLAFVQSIARKLKLKILTVSSLAYSYYSSLQEISSEYRNCVFVNLNTSSTEVCVAFGGGIVGTRFINMGLISVVEQIADKLDLHYDESLEVLDKYKKGTLESNLSVEIRKIIRRFYILWIKGLNSVFADFAGIKTFSSKVLVTGEGFDILDLWELVASEPWFKSIPFKAPPDFEKLILSDKLTEVSDLTGKASSAEWNLPVSLATVYLQMQKE